MNERHRKEITQKEENDATNSKESVAKVQAICSKTVEKRFLVRRFKEGSFQSL